MEKNESIGIVSGAYFVGRSQILKWVNDFGHFNYTKVEQTATGVFICHVFDALYPGQLRLDKVKFDARREYDIVHNYKVLQGCFNRVGMKRQIDVQKIIKGKSQDNLEFMQWAKAYFDTHATEEAKNYDALSRRQEVMGRAGSISSNDSLSLTRNAPSTSPSSRPPTRKPISASLKNQTKASTAPTSAKSRTPLYNPVKGARANATSAQVTKLKEEIQQLKGDKEELQAAVEDSVSEREFYFNKLRKVELICQAASDQVADGQDSVDFFRDALEEIKLILYAEDDVPVDENPEEQDEVVNEAEAVQGQFDDEDDGVVYHDVNDPAYQETPPDRNGHGLGSV